MMRIASHVVWKVFKMEEIIYIYFSIFWCYSTGLIYIENFQWGSRGISTFFINPLNGRLFHLLKIKDIRANLYT